MLDYKRTVSAQVAVVFNVLAISKGLVLVGHVQYGLESQISYGARIGGWGKSPTSIHKLHGLDAEHIVGSV